MQGEGNVSPFLGQTVLVDTSIVTYATENFAYIQDPKGDQNPLTSNGLLLTGGPLLSLSPGDLVRVTGQVRESDNMTSIGGNVSITTLGSGGLPTPVPLQAATDFAAVSPYERYEGMRVSFNVTIGQGSSDFNSVSVYPTANRPFREPGLEPPGINGLPMWDGNPEVIGYDPNGLGQANQAFYNAGDRLSGVGIVEQFSFGYELSPVQPVTEILAEVVRPVRAREADELSVASFNVLFLLQEESNYALHLTKVVNYIQNSLQFPDVIAIQEIGGQREVDDLVFRLRQANPTLGDYRGFSGTGTGDLKCAYLVSRRIQNPQLMELGTNELLSSGGVLHDRPPFLLTFNTPGDETTRLQVLNLHLRSLNGVDDSSFVRLKRKEQSVSVAQMVEELRDENLVIVGDYNAFAFSDGYVDVVNQIAGTPSLGALLPVENIVSPPLRVLSNELPPVEERYSFVFRGNAQQLDHCVINELAGLSANEMQYARGNSDASVNFFSQAFAAPRASDHDAFVLYLDIDALSSTNDNFLSEVSLQLANPIRAGGEIRYTNLPSNIHINVVDVTGKQVWTSTPRNNWPITGQGTEEGAFNLPPNLVAGTYFLQLTNGTKSRSYQVVVH